MKKYLKHLWNVTLGINLLVAFVMIVLFGLSYTFDWGGDFKEGFIYNDPSRFLVGDIMLCFVLSLFTYQD